MTESRKEKSYHQIMSLCRVVWTPFNVGSVFCQWLMPRHKNELVLDYKETHPVLGAAHLRALRAGFVFSWPNIPMCNEPSSPRTVILFSCVLNSTSIDLQEFMTAIPSSPVVLQCEAW